VHYFKDKVFLREFLKKYCLKLNKDSIYDNATQHEHCMTPLADLYVYWGCNKRYVEIACMLNGINRKMTEEFLPKSLISLVGQPGLEPRIDPINGGVCGQSVSVCK